MDVGADFIALSRDASCDRSFDFSYRIYREDLPEPVTVPRTQTTFVWIGLGPGETYSFHVEAVDASGNVSAPSNIATGTTTNVNDTPPTAPYGVTVTDVTSTSVSLWWEPATDDVGVSGYIIYNGPVPYGSVTPTGPTSATVSGLEYETTYAFYVVAEDTSDQEGTPSETVTATTLESVDTTPPSAPRSLYVAADVGCGNFFLDWFESEDDVDRQFEIRYDVYLDDEREPRGSVTGDYFIDTIELHVDIDPGGTHTFYLRAVDTSGNESEPSNTFTATDLCPWSTLAESDRGVSSRRPRPSRRTIGNRRTRHGSMTGRRSPQRRSRHDLYRTRSPIGSPPTRKTAKIACPKTASIEH